MIPVHYVRWGLANRFDDSIELNEALKGDMRLHDAILDHALGHQDNNTFKQDLVHDLTPINTLSQKELLIFMLKKPRTLTQLLPIYWSPRRKKLIYDLNMVIIYSVVLGGLALLIFLL